jgi:hypothetical protein
VAGEQERGSRDPHGQGYRCGRKHSDWSHSHISSSAEKLVSFLKGTVTFRRGLLSRRCESMVFLADENMLSQAKAWHPH